MGMDVTGSGSDVARQSGVVAAPGAQIEIAESHVRQLLVEQFPQLAGLELRHVARGWDNEVFRLGSELALRFPRRSTSAELMNHELTWFPSVGALCSLPVPKLLFRGQPDSTYPWNWSIVTWVPGTPVGSHALARSSTAARDLGRFVRGLNVPAPTNVPSSPWRGVPLADRSESVAQFAERAADLVEVEPLLTLWNEALAVPAFVGSPRWVHGDLHPLNILAQDGHISGVIDFGDLTSGDPAVDVAVAWLMFDELARETFLAESHVDHATTQRARGWAIFFGLAFLAHSANDPVSLDVGMATLNRFR
jgi:aminoglycoside phosphotransferase (APT) family kinase protein